jgi:L-proline amide hydrolase
VLYDQIGCGNSTHLPDAPADFWTVQLFKDELQLLLEHLGIANRYELVGQSWGGMLAMDWALDPRPGLVALGICDSPASMNLWVEEANRLRSELPDEVNATLLRHEEAGTTDSVEYVAATQFFYNRHVCRVVPIRNACSIRTWRWMPTPRFITR